MDVVTGVDVDVGVVWMYIEDDVDVYSGWCGCI